MSKTVIIRNVELFYPRLVTPHAPFGSSQWEVQVRTTDDATVAALKEAGCNVKQGDGYQFASIKRNEMKRNGEKNAPPVVVDKNKQPMDPSVSIGNGTVANLKLFSYDYNVNGRSGTSAMLSAVQVMDLVEYSGDVDFDVEDASGF